MSARWEASPVRWCPQWTHRRRVGIEIERDGQTGLARDRLEVGDEVGVRGRPGERAHRRQQLHRGGAAILRKMSELDRGPERRMGDTHHDRHAPADKIDGVLDQSLALFEAEIGVFLGFDPGGDNHGGAAVLDEVIDLTAKRGLSTSRSAVKGGAARRSVRIHHVILTPAGYPLAAGPFHCILLAQHQSISPGPGSPCRSGVGLGLTSRQFRVAYRTLPRGHMR